MSSAGASYAGNAHAVVAAPQGRSHFGEGELPQVLFDLIRENLGGRELAKIMGVNRRFNNLGPNLLIMRMLLHWLNHHATTLLKNPQQELENFLGGDPRTFAIDLPNIRKHESTLTHQNVAKIAERRVASILPRVWRQLMTPITPQNRVTVLALEHLPFTPLLATGVAFITYSWRAHPALRIPIIATTAFGWFIKTKQFINTLRLPADASAVTALVTYSKNNVVNTYVAQLVLAHRVRSRAQIIAYFAYPFITTAIAGGGFTLLLWAEESYLRPNLPSLISAVWHVWTLPISMVATGLTGVGLGTAAAGAAHLAQKVYRRYFGR